MAGERANDDRLLGSALVKMVPARLPDGIDHLAELPALQGPLMVHPRRVIGHFLRPEFDQSTTWTLPDEGLCAAHMSPVERRVNPLIVKELRVALPEQTLTRGPLVIRHDITSVFIHERALRMLQENGWPGEPCRGAIPNRPITNMADSV